MTTLDDIRRRMDGVPRHLSKEEKLREEHPGLKELWEQYQAMLKLVSPPEDTSSRKADDVLSAIRRRVKENLNPSNPCGEVPLGPKVTATEFHFDNSSDND